MTRETDPHTVEQEGVKTHEGEDRSEELPPKNDTKQKNESAIRFGKPNEEQGEEEAGEEASTDEVLAEATGMVPEARGEAPVGLKIRADFEGAEMVDI